MVIQRRPVLHMVDEATQFTAASFLKNLLAKETYGSIQRILLLVYMQPPDLLLVDQGTGYNSKEICEAAEAARLKVDETPIEAPGSIQIVELYHAPLGLAYEQIRMDFDREVSIQEGLEMAVFAMKCIVGPEGYCPILHQYGDVPRPARTTPVPSQPQRARLVEDAMKAIEEGQEK